VLCAVPDEPELEFAARRLRALGIPHAEFREPDLGGRLTAICTGPVADRRPFRRYPLLSPEEDLPCRP
jgi:hypothetical protein